MNKWMAERHLIIGYILAHIAIFFSFEDENIFWYIFTASMLILISYAIIHEDLEARLPALSYFSLGIISGVALYGLFWLGAKLIQILNLPFENQIIQLYNSLGPQSVWHYLVLIFILAPGEEIFWRGFIQKRISSILQPRAGIILSSSLYASVHFYSGEVILVLAAFIGGLAWGSLYYWKRSMPLLVLSHIVFDLLLFMFFPIGP